MKKLEKSVQSTLFSNTIVPVELSKLKFPLSAEEKLQRQEKVEARQAWKRLKSNKFRKLLTDREKILLKKYYNIDINYTR